jgi:membrane protease YdiL (CAAX protease family)
MRWISFFLLPAFIFFLNSFVLDPLGAYEAYPSFDIPMHIFGGMSIAVMGALFLNHWRNLRLYRAHWLVSVLFLVCFVSLFAVLWEWYEFIFFHTSQGDFADTMADFFFGIAGGAVVAFLTQWKR